MFGSPDRYGCSWASQVRMMGFWHVVGVLVCTFIITQVLVVCLQRRRIERIESKSMDLCSEVPAAPAVAGSAAEDHCRRVPITLITGFLGSGKTTLVNRVLTSSEHGLRVVVIENELGAVAIDHALIDTTRQEHMPDGVVVLKNGCMCCSGETPGSELERVLDKLLEMGRLEGGTLPFDCILIETSGLADPSPILQVLCRREMENSRFYLDAVITLIDCQNILRHLQPAGPFGFARRRFEAERQIGLADRLLLNKVDLVSEEEQAAVLAAVGAVNSSAAVLPTRNADVPLRHLLGLHAFSTAQWMASSSARLAYEPDPQHAAAVTCLSLRAGSLELALLQRWLQGLVQQRADDLYRLKGVLAIDGHDERFILHGIHAQVHGRALTHSLTCLLTPSSTV